jgi:aryl-alcohol dehydrogenase-like predicted oxidoreductase
MKTKAVAIVESMEKMEGEMKQKVKELGLGTYRELEEPEPTDQEAALEMVNAFFD